MLYYFATILLALGGFLIANHIWRHKRTGAALVCPIGTTCDTVIHSDYSRFFGLPIELLGMAYYGLIAVSYAALLYLPNLTHPTITFLLLALTTAALLFSVYLTFIQAFALRQWCTWCLISAALCASIFILAVFGSSYGFIALLAEHHAIFLGLHLLGVALGLGGATISDIMFFRFLKDLRISHPEKNVLGTLSEVIWLGLALLILSGLGLYLPEAAELNHSAKFLVKMIVVSVILVNGAFLNLLIAPNLVRISFGQSHEHMPGELHPVSSPTKFVVDKVSKGEAGFASGQSSTSVRRRATNGAHRIRKLSFAMGAVSLISWYSAFVLGLMRSSPAGFGTILLIYLGLIVLAVGGSQALERRLGRQPMMPTNQK